MPGLNTGGFYNRYATQNQMAGNTLGMMGGNKTTIRHDKPEEDPAKTLGGGLMAALGGAAGGTAAFGPGWGTAGGAGMGLAAYYMS